MLCYSLDSGFGGGGLVGRIVADRSAIMAFGSRSEPRLSSRAIRLLSCDAAPAPVLDLAKRRQQLDSIHRNGRLGNLPHVWIAMRISPRTQCYCCYN